MDYQRRTAYTYATTAEGRSALEEELQACRAAGVGASWTEETELPFPVTGALRLEDQAQIHPMALLQALLEELDERDGTVLEGVRVTGAADTDRSDVPLTVDTTAGTLTADQLILATGAPIMDRGGHFAKLTAHRSYALSFRLPVESKEQSPKGMYLSADFPSRTTRTVPMPEGTDAGEELLLVGGNDHGALPRGGGDIYVATGFNKWGMTNGVAAALALASEILHHDLGSGGLPTYGRAPHLERRRTLLGLPAARLPLQPRRHAVGRPSGGRPEAPALRLSRSAHAAAQHPALPRHRRPPSPSYGAGVFCV